MAAVLDFAHASKGNTKGITQGYAEPETITIASERSDDASVVAAREALLDRAMGPGRKRKSSESLRRGRKPAEHLALSATTDDGRLIGTVRLWYVAAGINHNGAVSALLLGPLAVDPAYEGQGIGARLMREAMARAEALGHGAILLVGDPEYYERFGFNAERAAHLVMPGPFERRRFLGLNLKKGHLDGATGLLTATGEKLA